jgi:hypothetical protein
MDGLFPLGFYIGNASAGVIKVRDPGTLWPTASANKANFLFLNGLKITPKRGLKLTNEPPMGGQVKTSTA